MEGGLIVNGLPTWAKVIATIGFPIAVATFLILQSTGWIPSEITAAQAAIIRHSMDADRHHQATENLARSVSIAARVMCENAANTPEQRRNCQAIP